MIDESALDKALKNSRIFGDASNTLLKDIANTVELRTVMGGEVVFAQGQYSDSMLVVVSGRLIARLHLPDGSNKNLSEISPGASAGELGLILEQPRAASVVAVRDSCIAVLSKKGFDSLLVAHPIDMNRAVTRTVYEYNTTLNRPPRNVSATVIVIINLTLKTCMRAFCQDITRNLEKFGRVRFVEQDSSARDIGDSKWSGFIHDLEQDNDYVLLAATGEDSDWSRMISRQADQILFVASEQGGQSDIDKHAFRSIDSPSVEVRKSLVLQHESNAILPEINSAWFEQFSTSDIYPIRSGNSEDIARLCRFITDNAVGLVLGGGGARGLAHVGVLRALEEFSIPVDILCGNSMGALIAAQYAVGVDLDSLVSSTQKFISGGEMPTLPFFSLLSGNRIKKDLKCIFGDIQLEAMWRPFFCVSCNLSKAGIYVHEQGPLWKAVLASNSPAGILPPVIENGSMMVDAALLDNVPVESMRSRLRYGTIIAVDVDVNEDLILKEGISHFDLWNHFKQKLSGSKQTELPGIIEILNRAGHLGGLARRKQAIAIADLYLQPPVSEFGLMAYKRGEEIAEKAYEYAKSSIESWSKDRVLTQY